MGARWRSEGGPTSLLKLRRNRTVEFKNQEKRQAIQYLLELPYPLCRGGSNSSERDFSLEPWRRLLSVGGEIPTLRDILVPQIFQQIERVDASSVPFSRLQNRGGGNMGSKDECPRENWERFLLPRTQGRLSLFQLIHSQL